MEQNIEFVNLFIQKQKNYIDDLVGKNLVLETKVAVLEAKIATLESAVLEAQSKNSKKTTE